MLDDVDLDGEVAVAFAGIDEVLRPHADDDLAARLQAAGLASGCVSRAPSWLSKLDDGAAVVRARRLARR